MVADSFSGKARQLYECYRTWAEGAGENTITETLFGRRLKDQGFAKEHRRHGTAYAFIALRVQGCASGEEVWRVCGVTGCDAFFSKHSLPRVLQGPFLRKTGHKPSQARTRHRDRRRWYPFRQPGGG